MILFYLYDSGCSVLSALQSLEEPGRRESNQTPGQGTHSPDHTERI